jgi:transmembrane protein TMEM43
MIRALVLGVALMAASGISRVASAQQAAPTGAPQPDKTLRDPEFGVVAHHVGLERVVEMLQWQPAASGYTRTWSTDPIDSTDFGLSHQNPAAFPLRGRRWMAGSVTVDGKPLDAEVIRRLGAWQEFRPSFSALPGNLAATFQPEGNGLGSAQNPLDPRIGDLRIHWRDLVLPPLEGHVELRAGRWQLVAAAPAAVGPPSNALATIGQPAAPRRWFWWSCGALIVAIVALAVRLRRKS